MDEARTRDIEEIERRLARAERQLRAFRLGAFAAVLLAVTVRTVGSSWARLASQKAPSATANTVLRAPVQVVDASGRVLLSVENSGSRTNVTVSPGDGSLAVRITADRDSGGSVNVLNSASAPVASLGRTAKSGTLFITDIEGKVAAELGCTGFGGEVDLYNKAGVRTVGLGCTEQGGGLTVFAKGGAAMVGLGVTDQGGGMTVWDKNGRPVYSAP